MKSRIYEGRGVSSQKNEVHQAIAHLDQGLFPGAFCKILPDHLTGDPEACLLLHADGAGTKSSLAYLYWRETGDLSVFKGIAQDSLVMNLDDLGCVGAVTGFVLSNTLGRNAFRIPGLVVKTIIEGYEEQIELLAQEGVIIHSCGGETADLGDLVRTLVADSTLAVRMKRSEVIDLSKLTPGLAIVGFASYGQARWETAYNSGIGSNGLTAARHDSLSGIYKTKYPESFSPEMPLELAYAGKHLLTEPLAGTPLDWGKALLSPTRTYLPLIKQALQEFRSSIKGMVHCSGGGQTKCLKFGRNLAYHKTNLLPVPPLFQAIRHDQNLTWKEMFPVFNMGHRLEMYVEPTQAVALVELGQACGIAAQVIGQIQASPQGNQVVVTHEGESYSYP